jgi:integrase
MVINKDEIKQIKDIVEQQKLKASLLTDELIEIQNIVNNKTVKNIDVLRQKLNDYLNKKIEENNDNDEKNKRECILKREAQKKGKFLLFNIPNSENLYVQFRDDNNNLLNGHWSTGTPDVIEAITIANKKRAEFISYFNTKQLENQNTEVSKILLNYYSKDSEYLKKDEARKHTLNDIQRVKYDGYMKNYFIPFFNERKIQYLNEITIDDLEAARDYILTTRKLSSKTCNNSIAALRRIFERAKMDKLINKNPFTDGLTKINKTTVISRGTFNDKEFENFFKTVWEKENYKYYMIALTGFMTGIRNSEFNYLKVSDKININGIWFFDLKGSKTDSAVRKIPLHDFYVKKIDKWIEDNNLKEDDYLFKLSKTAKRIYDRDFDTAAKLAGKMIGYTDQEIESKNITYYGFRRLYASILSGNGISTMIHRYFMGHKQDQNEYKYINLGQIDITEMAQKTINIFNTYFV